MRTPPLFVLLLSIAAAAASQITAASAFSFAAPPTIRRRLGPSCTSSSIGKSRYGTFEIESSLRFASCCSSSGDTLNIHGDAVTSLHHDQDDTEMEHHTQNAHHHNHHHHHSAGLTPLTALSILCWLVSMLSHSRSVNLGYLRYAGLASVALGTPTIASKARRAVFVRRRVDASCMMLAASLGAVALGDLTEAAAVSSLFAVSESLEGRAESRSTEALSDVARDIGPGRAFLLVASPADGNNDVDGNNTGEEDGLTVSVPADQVAVGSTVSVPVGERVPCDGTVLGGISSVDESSITGESKPVVRRPGDAVPGGAVNAGPTRLVVRTAALSSDSAVGRLARLVEESRSRRSPTERMVDELAGRYAPPVFLAALGMCTIPWLAFGPDVGRAWMRNGLVTLVAACPCPLVISTPVTYVAGLANMARQGIIVKGGAVLEVRLSISWVLPSFHR